MSPLNDSPSNGSPSNISPSDCSPSNGSPSNVSLSKGSFPNGSSSNYPPLDGSSASKVMSWVAGSEAHYGDDVQIEVSDIVDSFDEQYELSPTPSSSMSRNGPNSSVPKIPGIWVDWFTIGRKWDKGAHHTRFLCASPGCRKHFSPGSSSSTLRYHFQHDHPKLYEKHIFKGKGVDSPARVQSTLNGTTATKARLEALVTAALDWVVGDYLPFSVLDSPDFRRLIQLVNPVARIPCAATVRSRLNGHRLGLEQKLEDLFQETFQSGAMTIDDWTSSSGCCFLGLTLHWLDKSFRLLECALEVAPYPYPHNAQSIKEIVEDAISKRGFDGKITALTTDSTAVMLGAAGLANLPHLPCIAHILHHSVLKALEQSEVLSKIVAKCHDLARLFHASPKLTKALEKEQKRKFPSSEPLAIIRDVKTRWNSTLAMLRRLIQLRGTIDSVYISLVLSPFEAVNKGKLEELKLSESEWKHVSNVVAILDPFEETTLIFSSSSSRGLAACVLAWISALSLGLEAQTSTVVEIENFRICLQDELSNRVKNTESLVKASFFHPTFNLIMRRIDLVRFNEIKTLLLHEYEEIALANDQPLLPTTSTPAPGVRKANLRRLLAMQDQAPNGEGTDSKITNINDFERYFTCRQCDDIEVDPCQWWLEHQAVFPFMSQLARKYLAIPASSVKSERLASDYVADKRNRLDDDAVGGMVVSNETNRCLKRAKVEATQDTS